MHSSQNKLYSPWIWWLLLSFLSQDDLKDQRKSFVSLCLLVYYGLLLVWLHFRKEFTNLKSQVFKIELSLLLELFQHQIHSLLIFVRFSKQSLNSIFFKARVNKENVKFLHKESRTRWIKYQHLNEDKNVDHAYL